MTNKSRNPDEAWFNKLLATYQSASQISVADGEHDVRLAALALKRSYEYGSMIVGHGLEPLKMEIHLDQPECFACGKCTLERGGKLLYCSDACQDIAGSVRYARKKIDECAPWDAALLMGFGQKIYQWVSTGHPYDARTRTLTEESRQAIFERDGRVCVLCGEPATQIDHIAGSSPDPKNLQAICANCNRDRMLAGLKPITDPNVRRAFHQRLDFLAELIAAPEPPSLGFDHTKWQGEWALYSRVRKSRLPSSLPRKLGRS